MSEQSKKALISKIVKVYSHIVLDSDLKDF